MSDVLTIDDLRVEFRLHEATIEAVRGVSFSIPANRTVALVGESGSGKSVVSQSIMRILPPTATITGGSIKFRDPKSAGAETELTAFDENAPQLRAIRGGRISIIFQEPMTSLSSMHTIGDQVGEALHLHRAVTPQEGRELAADMLRLVGFPDPERALRTYPFELSGGLRQRAMIAMALVCRPGLLIADEPTTALDVTIQAQILKLMRDLQQELGMSVLMITHDLGVVANVADEIVVMYHGQVLEQGTLNDIFRNPGHDYLKALLRAVPRFDMVPGERLQPLRELTHSTGHLLAEKEPWPDQGADEPPILSVRGLTKRFTLRKGGFFGGENKSVLAVDDVSFDVARGTCLGIVGESGSGKTTVSKLIMRALESDQGDIIYNDRGIIRDLAHCPASELLDCRQRIQMIFQDPFSSLNPRMTIYDIISEPLVIHNIGDAEWRTEMVRELLALVGLDPRFLNRYPHSFSGGQRQRIGIARALALKPDLLLCDEPVSALDVSVQAQILNLMKDLRDELGLSYIFVSHNLAVVDYIADVIAVMCAGRLVELAPREALFRQPVHPYTRALLAAVPKPDPNDRLNLGALMDGRASEPTAWPAPFTQGGPDDHDSIGFIDLGDGHFVRADRDVSPEALTA
jgi:peptide/nickel transport system ATP-binding protein